jgi:hypothetical protein
MANTLAYYDTTKITEVESFIIQASEKEVDIIKTFLRVYTSIESIN